MISKQFCPKNHNTFICGRNPANGSCKECDRIRGKERYIPVIIDKRKTQFCPKNHDKNILGRLKDGNCKECKRVNIQIWRHENLEKAKILYDAANARRRNSGKLKNWYLKRNYKITLEQYNNILKNQKYCCAICGLSLEKYEKSFHVDHNHKTNRVRGLLCYPCNALLGYAKDNVEILKRSILYLMEDRKSK